MDGMRLVVNWVKELDPLFQEVTALKGHSSRAPSRIDRVLTCSQLAQQCFFAFLISLLIYPQEADPIKSSAVCCLLPVQGSNNFKGMFVAFPTSDIC